MLKPTDNFFVLEEEPVKSCLLALRKIILSYNKGITEKWMYGMPFYYYQHKRFCYLWVHKKYKQPYLGIVAGAKINHPLLIRGKRTKMKIMLIDPVKDLPVKIIEDILRKTIVIAAI